MIHRANPALRETDRVLAILARQNRVLGRPGARTPTPCWRAARAREKRRVSDFIVQANRTGQATAERRADIERGIQRLPGFLRELRPLMADLDGFAGQATPVVRDLNSAGEDISRLIRQLGPFSEGARVSLLSLGEATETGRPALIRTRPLIRDLASFGREGRPLAANLDRLTKSFDETGGIERALDYLFFQMTAVNGFDDIGHYLRAELIVNLCTPLRGHARSGLQRQLHGHSRGRVRSIDEAGHRRANRQGARRDGREGQRQRGSHGRGAGRHPGHRGPRLRRGAAKRQADQAQRGAGLAGAAGHRRADARIPPGERPVSRRAGVQGLTASPVLVGAVTVLVTIVAVFLSYNANSGLPFVPTYDLKAKLPNAANLVRGQRGAHRRRARGRDRQDRRGATWERGERGRGR